MMFHIDHIAFSVKNVDESIRFYNLLGFIKFNEWHSSDGLLRMIMLKNEEDIYIELVYCGDNKPLPDFHKSLDTDLSYIGIKHLALRVESLDKTIAFLKKNWCDKDYEVLLGKLGRRYFMINDPDGIILEFIEMPKL